MSGVAITDDNTSNFRAGSKAVGTAAVQITATSVKVTRGVQVRADDGNTDKIYIGPSALVTAGLATPATDGYKLAAGEHTLVPIDDISKIWLISGSASQAISYLAV